ncbi:hypothetical protein [Lysobacter sp. CA199]|uniref:hypothetical protein n=1 Tax=Lysobacter sp. CA199 TaxID=3455608 RepID=UPI003F8D11AD
MRTSSPLKWVLAMAAVCMAGIVGMLVADGIADTAFFVLAALPLAVGLWRWHRRRKPAPRGS